MICLMKAKRKPKQGKKKRSADREVFIGFHGSKDIAKALSDVAVQEDRSTSSVLRRIVAESLAQRVKPDRLIVVEQEQPVLAEAAKRISQPRVQYEKLPTVDKK